MEDHMDPHTYGSPDNWGAVARPRAQQARVAKHLHQKYFITEKVSVIKFHE